MIGTLISFAGTINTGFELYRNITGILRGDITRGAQDTKLILQRLDELRARPERLDNGLYYAPNMLGVVDTTRTEQTVLRDPRVARELLQPIQRGLDSDVVATGLIATPNRMRAAMQRNPFDAFLHVRPAKFWVQPPDLGLVPVMFEVDGVQYIGWQMRGALPAMFDCELHDLPGLGATAAQPIRVVSTPSPSATVLTPPRVLAAAASKDDGLTAGKEFRDGPDLPVMVVVPAGSFMMGSPETEGGRSETEGPQHKVTIAKPFAVGKFAVTFDEWDACVSAGGCKSNPKPSDHRWGRGTRPVINVSWNDAKEYVAWISKKVGRAYRLLSEAEWEYACRAGTTTPFSFGETISTSQANYDGSHTYGNGVEGVDRRRTVPVGTFPANRFGLHDMHGNVWEWVEDCWKDDFVGASVDGSARIARECKLRVCRGGSWFVFPDLLRSASRGMWETNYRIDNLGFRLARSL